MSLIGKVAQMVVQLGVVVGQAFIQAYQQAAANPRAMEQAAARAASASASGMNALEARQVLNFVTSEEVTKEAILAAYRKYYAANAVTKGGGSLYLQAKISNAKDALYEELGFVETPEEAEEDYKLLHEDLADKAEEVAEDLDSEKTKAK